MLSLYTSSIVLSLYSSSIVLCLCLHQQYSVAEGLAVSGITGQCEA